MNHLLSILLMAGPQGGQAGGGYEQIIFLVLIIVVFYFFMIRDGLQKGDKVVTTGGIYGKVNDIKENIVVVEIAANVTVKVDKSSVVREIADIQGKK